MSPVPRRILPTCHPPIRAIRIGEPLDPVLIRGQSVGVVSPGEHRVLRILSEAWPKGFTKAEMTELFGGDAWRQILRRLIERLPVFRSAIGFRPYRIL